MRLLQNITDEPLQKHTVTLDDGSTFTIQIGFMPMQKSWFMNTLQYGSFEMNCTRLSNNINILHQFRNKLPFGLACISEDNREPMLQGDFATGKSKLYLLDEGEVDAYDRFLRG